jgi:hypothetical protein
VHLADARRAMIWPARRHAPSTLARRRA